MSRPSLSKRSDVSIRTIARVEAGERVKLGTLKSIRDGLRLNVSDDELMEIAIPVADDLDENVSPYEESDGDIPRFDLNIAASGWVDVFETNQDAGHRPTESQLRRKIFEVRVRGDSMDGGLVPIPDGQIVRFRLVFDGNGVADCSQIVIGHGYYVQLSDGRATFKAAVDCADGVLTLKATNKKYKKPLTAPVSEITRLGQLIGLVFDAQKVI